jgi:hypothetical protein
MQATVTVVDILTLLPWVMTQKDRFYLCLIDQGSKDEYSCDHGNYAFSFATMFATVK